MKGPIIKVKRIQEQSKARTSHWYICSKRKERLSHECLLHHPKYQAKLIPDVLISKGQEEKDQVYRGKTFCR
jgi:hypothetical protein